MLPSDDCSPTDAEALDDCVLCFVYENRVKTRFELHANVKRSGRKDLLIRGALSASLDRLVKARKLVPVTAKSGRITGYLAAKQPATLVYTGLSPRGRTWQNWITDPAK